jgi:hypothetical protein
MPVAARKGPGDWAMSEPIQIWKSNEGVRNVAPQACEYARNGCPRDYSGSLGGVDFSTG